MTTIDDLLVEAYSHWDDAEVLSRTGRELHDRNRLDHARVLLERAVELRPDGDPYDWSALSFAYMRGFEHAKGLDALRRGLAATGSDALRSILSGYSDDEDEKTAMTEAIAESTEPGIVASRLAGEFYQGDAEQKLAELRALLEEHPDDEDVQGTLCWILMGGAQQGLIEAVEIRELGLPLTRARIAAEPDKTRHVHLELAMLGAIEDWDGVLDASARALERFPDEESIMHLRGRALREKGDRERAVAWFSRAIGAKPSFAGARVDLGKIYEAMERFDLAEEVFREITPANPGYPGGRVSLALFLSRRERWDEAEALIIEAWPDLPPWMKGGLPQNPDAKPLLERPSVKAAIGTQDEESEN